MSCGSAGPSTIISPLFTTWPSCAITCLSFGIRYSWATPSRSVMTRRCLPLVSLPNDTVPVISASRPASFGERASNSSATRGRPPVMSRVFEVSCGMRASTSPTCTCCPSFTVMMRVDLEGDVDRQLGARDLHLLALVVDQLDARTQPLGLGDPAALGIDHHQGRQAGDLVDLLGHRHAFLDVLELDATGVLGDDRAGVRVPGRQHLARLHLRAVHHRQRRAVGHLVALALAAVVVDDDHFAAARDRNRLAARIGHVAHQRREAHRAVGLALQLARHRGPRCRTADVEGAHGELRARLADGLRGDHADRFADVHQLTAPEIAAVALRAQAVAGVAGERRAHLALRRYPAPRCARPAPRSSSVPAGMHHLPGLRDGSRRSRHAAQDALAQRFDHFAALDQGLHGDAFVRCRSRPRSPPGPASRRPGGASDSRSSRSSTPCRPGPCARRASR